MAVSAARPRDTTTLLPLSRAHQEGLHALVEQLRAGGQDVELLAQLAESLPRLRAGLPTVERERVEALDANETTLLGALGALQEAIDAFDALLGAPEQALPPSTLLVHAAQVRQLAAIAQALAEAATDLALRANARAGLLE